MDTIRRRDFLQALCLLGVSTARAEGFEETVRIGDSSLNLFIEDQPFRAGNEVLSAWVADSAGIVADYYATFPVREAYIALRGRASRAGVIFGRAIGQAGAVVNVTVGLGTNELQLRNDWILIHELIHLAFPTVPRRHHWIEEGLAVYVESVARASAGQIPAENVWTGFIDGMPRGLPRPGDKGLDNTPTWGRTYWGGALFCLLADIRIRENTQRRKSLRDALRAIVTAGYDITRSSELLPVLRIADAATDTEVLQQLYADMRADPYPVDLDALWDKLGIVTDGARLSFDEQAPLAAIRGDLTSSTQLPDD